MYIMYFIESFTHTLIHVVFIFSYKIRYFNERLLVKFIKFDSDFIF